MEEKNSQILFRHEKKSNQWFCIHDTDKYHIKVFFESFSNVKYKKKLGVKLRMVGSWLNSCRKLIDYLTKNSSSVRIYHWQNIVFFFDFPTWACDSDFYNRFLTSPQQIPLQNRWYKWILMPAHPSWWNNMTRRYEFVYIFLNLAHGQRWLVLSSFPK